MKRSYKIHFVNKHLIFKDGENTILFDTGSPITIHTADRLEFAGLSYPTTTNAMGNTIANLQSMSGVSFTTLMGLDIIMQYNIILDYANEDIVFMSLDEPTPAGTPIPIQQNMGAIIMSIKVANQEHCMILDTGATYSYINSAITARMTPIETITDFSPLVGGEFDTPIFEIESEVANVKFSCRYGNLPKTIEMMIRMLGTEGVIGYDFLASCKLMICVHDNRAILLRD